VTVPSALRHLEAELAALAASGLLRVEPSREELDPQTAGPAPVVACSNDYLGYGAEPWPAAADDAPLPSGSGASRLVVGEHLAHRDAERALAEWVGAADALLFASGYAANVGTVSALAGPGDLVVSDALNHASLIDGCRLSGARVEVVPHLDAGAVELALGRSGGYRRRWVVTESYFSMDGDTPDLARLRDVCDLHDAGLVVDEAHALGVFGPRGAGRCAEVGVRADVLLGTMGKAVGLQGAFVAGPVSLRSWLWNRARSFVFSTGVSPVLARAVTARVARAVADDAGRARLVHAGRALRAELTRLGVEVASADGPILPVVVGDAGRALGLSRQLLAEGVRVQAIRPPTVAVGSSRLRITASASLADARLERVVAAFRAVWG
jgi:8-amino-7-oxononanoate synthase